MIRVGASGFSYKDRIGPYSPPGLGERGRRAFYAHELSTCELNFTIYRLPNAKTLARMAARRPPGFFYSRSGRCGGWSIRTIIGRGRRWTRRGNSS